MEGVGTSSNGEVMNRSQYFMRQGLEGLEISKAAFFGNEDHQWGVRVPVL